MIGEEYQEYELIYTLQTTHMQEVLASSFNLTLGDMTIDTHLYVWYLDQVEVENIIKHFITIAPAGKGGDIVAQKLKELLDDLPTVHNNNQFSLYNIQVRVRPENKTRGLYRLVF